MLVKLVRVEVLTNTPYAPSSTEVPEIVPELVKLVRVEVLTTTPYPRSSPAVPEIVPELVKLVAVLVFLRTVSYTHLRAHET